MDMNRLDDRPVKGNHDYGTEVAKRTVGAEVPIMTPRHPHKRVTIPEGGECERVAAYLDFATAFKAEVEAAVREMLEETDGGESIRTYPVFYSMMLRVQDAAWKLAGAPRNPLEGLGSAESRSQYLDKVWLHVEEALARMSNNP
jgi:hypothetical protein